MLPEYIIVPGNLIHYTNLYCTQVHSKMAAAAADDEFDIPLFSGSKALPEIAKRTLSIIHMKVLAPGGAYFYDNVIEYTNDLFRGCAAFIEKVELVHWMKEADKDTKKLWDTIIHRRMDIVDYYNYTSEASQKWWEETWLHFFRIYIDDLLAHIFYMNQESFMVVKQGIKRHVLPRHMRSASKR